MKLLSQVNIRFFTCFKTLQPAKLANVTEYPIFIILINRIETNKVEKGLYLIRQYNIQIFDRTIFLNYRTRQVKATERNK